MLVAEDSAHSIPPPAPERTSSNKEITPTPLEFVHTEPFIFARRDLCGWSSPTMEPNHALLQSHLPWSCEAAPLSWRTTEYGV